MVIKTIIILKWYNNHYLWYWIKYLYNIMPMYEIIYILSIKYLLARF